METEAVRLADLCERVAAGDLEAAAEFDRELLPLIEVMARRTLRARAHAAAEPCSDAPSGAGRESDRKAPELARRVSRSLVDRVRLRRERARRDTLALHPAWATRQFAATTG